MTDLRAGLGATDVALGQQRCAVPPLPVPIHPDNPGYQIDPKVVPLVAVRF